MAESGTTLEAEAGLPIAIKDEAYYMFLLGDKIVAESPPPTLSQEGPKANDFKVENLLETFGLTDMLEKYCKDTNKMDTSMYGYVSYLPYVPHINDSLFQGAELLVNTPLDNCNGHTAMLLPNGNFVLLDASRTRQVYWASGTEGKGGKSVCIESTGDLVMYDAHQRVVWKLPMDDVDRGRGPYKCKLRYDNELAIYGAEDRIVWKTDVASKFNASKDAAREADLKEADTTISKVLSLPKKERPIENFTSNTLEAAFKLAPGEMELPWQRGARPQSRQPLKSTLDMIPKDNIPPTAVSRPSTINPTTTMPKSTSLPSFISPSSTKDTSRAQTPLPEQPLLVDGERKRKKKDKDRKEKKEKRDKKDKKDKKKR
eukprot:Ihof_evm4s243 gene=Ihof_evmTU4s243